ncbi:hypothetical protein S40293_07554 [Stachybotrys chartarum IBT 40293]|nr:hypothetical protein S40293_07554 [Stachybotrys chartarum IBT 40293]
MLPDQRGRSMSTSAAHPTKEGETCQDVEAQITETAQRDEAMEASQVSPRTASRASPPAPTPLSRNPSSSSSVSTPGTEFTPCGVFGPSQPRSAEPPVTKATLSELDVSKIIHNPKLRHDINFDPDLHFRPNLDGEKGRKKAVRANQFWETLKAELTEFIIDRPSFARKHGETDEWSLPALLKAVKEIIQTLVPQRDRQFLDEGLNVELLMQQFNKGVADLEKLALWLSSVLKSHCAPMRDEWVDTMYNQLSNGNRQGDVDLLVTGMRSLLSVLEAMKLDVANHQIRCLRPVLIEDTSNFEQRFFVKKMQSGKLDVSPSVLWYREAQRKYATSTNRRGQAFGEMSVFFEALVDLILPSEQSERVPNTFLFDEERIQKLRSDMMDAVNLEVCMRMYEDLEFQVRHRTSQATDEAHDDDASLNGVDDGLSTPPFSSRPSSLVFSSAGSTTSSPRSSLVVPAYVAPDYTDYRAKYRSVLSSLVALMQSVPSTSRQSGRWEGMAASVAIQIFRFTDAPMDMLAAFEEQMAANLKWDSQLHQTVERDFRNRLLSDVAMRVREFKALSCVALFTAATSTRAQVPRHSGRERDLDSILRDSQEEGGIADAAMRITHLGILHWRVWGELAYAGEEDAMSLDAPSTPI